MTHIIHSDESLEDTGKFGVDGTELENWDRASLTKITTLATTGPKAESQESSANNDISGM